MTAQSSASEAATVCSSMQHAPVPAQWHANLQLLGRQPVEDVHLNQNGPRCRRHVGDLDAPSSTRTSWMEQWPALRPSGLTWERCTHSDLQMAPHTGPSRECLLCCPGLLSSKPVSSR